jgi:hypothetical protein
MKQRFSSKAVFIGKSLIWSIMIYVGCMMAMNWDEVTYALKAKQSISSIAHVITQPPVIPATIATDEPITKSNISTSMSVLGIAKNVLFQVVRIASGK